MRTFLPLVVALLATGCGGSVVSAPRVAAPETFGPVERVGGSASQVTANASNRVRVGMGIKAIAYALPEPKVAASIGFHLTMKPRSPAQPPKAVKP